jgi:2-aminoethylphosphonate transport system permease protein
MKSALSALLFSAAALTTPAWAARDLPLVAPYLLAAFGLSFALSMGELGATVMVCPPGWITMPVAIFGLTDRGDIFSGAVLTMILAAVTLALLIGLERTPFRSAAAR